MKKVVVEGSTNQNNMVSGTFHVTAIFKHDLAIASASLEKLKDRESMSDTEYAAAVALALNHCYGALRGLHERTDEMWIVHDYDLFSQQRERKKVKDGAYIQKPLESEAEG